MQRRGKRATAQLISSDERWECVSFLSPPARDCTNKYLSRLLRGKNFIEIDLSSLFQGKIQRPSGKYSSLQFLTISNSPNHKTYYKQHYLHHHERPSPTPCERLPFRMAADSLQLLPTLPQRNHHLVRAASAKL
jgi:hypothetical protein